MFENLKNLSRLKKLKDSLGEERMEAEKQGVKVVLNGEMKVEEIKLNPELNQDQQETVLKDCINEAMGKIQKLVAQKMMQQM